MMAMTMAIPQFHESSIARPVSLCPRSRRIPIQRLTVLNRSNTVANAHRVLYGGAGAANICRQFCGLKLWILKNLNLRHPMRKHQQSIEFRSIKNQEKDASSICFQNDATTEGPKSASDTEEIFSHHVVSEEGSSSVGNNPSSPQPNPSNFATKHGGESSLCIAVIGATGLLAKTKVFPALFALYYSGFLPENVCIFGYSRKNLTDEDLRSIISSTLTCRIDHQQNCGEKMESFLSRTYYLDGGYDNEQGMLKLNARMELFEGLTANRIFYLSVPHEALLDVASSVSSYAQTRKGWNRIITEKPFGFDAICSQKLTRYLLSMFEENQIYRIDHLLGRNLIENLTVLRFSNLVFEPLWSRKYIRNIQVLLSEDINWKAGKYFEGYGIIRDVVHSHILQIIALLAMEPPISLHGEDIRNEKVKVLRSMRKIDLKDVILGQCKATSGDETSVRTDNLTPTFFAAALYIDNARWDGVPFMVRTGMGLIKHRMEIRLQFHPVPGNIYQERIGHNIDQATNELILRDVPDEAILIKMNNKIPGLGLHLDASELNLLYKDKYNAEVPDSYEHLLLDVIDGDNHLFLRSDELGAAWNILTPILNEIDKKNISPELYELGGRGPVGAYYLWAKHGIQWADD